MTGHPDLSNRKKRAGCRPHCHRIKHGRNGSAPAGLDCFGQQGQYRTGDGHLDTAPWVESNREPGLAFLQNLSIAASLVAGVVFNALSSRYYGLNERDGIAAAFEARLTGKLYLGQAKTDRQSNCHAIQVL